MGDIVTNRGFNRSGVSPQAYLAGVIQGEARSPAGQFAVASVIANRAEASSSGFADNVVGVASQGADTGHGVQFSGYNPNYSPQAYALAGAAINGNLSDYGNTGGANGALYYNGPGGSSYNAYVNGGGPNIGGNVFSDRYGQGPSSDFVAPQYNPGAYVASSQSQTQGGLPAFAQGEGGATDPYTTTGVTGVTGTQGSGAPAFTQLGQDQFSTQGQGFTGAGSGIGQPDGVGSIAPSYSTKGPYGGSGLAGAYAGSGMDGGAPLTVTKAPQVAAMEGSVGYADAGGAGGAFGGGGGIPLQITDATEVGSQAGQTVQKGLEGASKSVDGLTKGVGQDTQSAIAAGTGWLGSFESFGTDLLVRFGFLLFALALLAGAWVFYGKSKGGSTVIVPV